jgi:hypothetical protein
VARARRAAHPTFDMSFEGRVGPLYYLSNYIASIHDYFRAVLGVAYEQLGASKAGLPYFLNYFSLIQITYFAASRPSVALLSPAVVLAPR